MNEQKINTNLNEFFFIWLTPIQHGITRPALVAYVEKAPILVKDFSTRDRDKQFYFKTQNPDKTSEDLVEITDKLTAMGVKKIILWALILELVNKSYMYDSKDGLVITVVMCSVAVSCIT